MSVSSWIKSRPPRGHYTFTRSELERALSDMSVSAVSVALSREVKKGVLFSPWQGFYVIVPDEYKLRGVVPQSFYINDMMDFLGKSYYVSLLSAAEHYGAAHQAPMTFYVMIEPPALRDKYTDTYSTRFSKRSCIPAEYIERVAVKTGWLNFSCPELTAIDLITYRQNIGGLSRAATVLAELADHLNFSSFGPSFLKVAPISDFQRLGFILDAVLEEEKVAEELLSLLQAGNIHTKPVRLRSDHIMDGYPRNKKWNIIVNTEVEPDDL